MKKVSVSGGKFWAQVDDEDFELVNRYKWWIDRGRHGDIYAKTSNYKNIDPDWPATIQMHRLIMGQKKGMCIDHIDHDGLNNQKCNLRVVTNKQNCLNRQKQIGEYTSSYKGICWNKVKQKWHAYVNIEDNNVGKKFIHLGYYDDEQTAALAYDRKMKELCPNDLLLPNFPLHEGEYPEYTTRSTDMKGCWWDKKRKIYLVELKRQGKRYRGYAKTAEEALAKRKEFEEQAQKLIH